jgi:two-component system NarL family sensor kinase
MNTRAARVVAWGSLGLSVLSVLVTLALLLGFKAPASLQIAPQEYVFGLSFLGFSIVGALVTPVRPENPLGWLFCAAGVFSILAVATTEYGIQALYGGLRNWPAAEFSIWISTSLSVVGIGILAFILLLFPSGKLLSPRWRPVAWLAAFVPLFAITVGALVPGHSPEVLAARSSSTTIPSGSRCCVFLLRLVPISFPPGPR